MNCGCMLSTHAKTPEPKNRRFFESAYKSLLTHWKTTSKSGMSRTDNRAEPKSRSFRFKTVKEDLKCKLKHLRVYSIDRLRKRDLQSFLSSNGAICVVERIEGYFCSPYRNKEVFYVAVDGLIPVTIFEATPERVSC